MVWQNMFGEQHGPGHHFNCSFFFSRSLTLIFFSRLAGGGPPAPPARATPPAARAESGCLAVEGAASLCLGPTANQSTCQ